MPDQNAFCFERFVDVSAVHVRVLHEDEIPNGIRQLEPEPLQFADGEVPVLHDLAAVRRGVFLVLEDSLRGGHGHGIDVVRVRRIAQRVHVCDQRFARDAVAQPRPCQGAGFGHGLHHQHVVVFRRQVDAGLRPEIHVRLIDDDHVVRVGAHDFLDVRSRQRHAGVRVRVGEKNRPAGIEIVFFVDGEILPQRHLHIRDVVDLREDRIESVRHVREHRRRVLIAKRHECKIQDLVRSVPHQNVARLHAELVRQFFRQDPNVRIGIQLQPAGGLRSALDGFCRWRER